MFNRIIVMLGTGPSGGGKPARPDLADSHKRLIGALSLRASAHKIIFRRR
jgi:hypothetical protein